MRIRRVSARAVALVAAVMAVVAISVTGLWRWPSGRQSVAAVVGAPARAWRAFTGPRLDAVDGLAASQLGYLPAGPKGFTSPRPFRTFAVVDAANGDSVWRGTGAVTVDGRDGAATAWVGDFSAFERPGRFRLVADNGLASLPFSIGRDVYAPAARVMQRTFYFQRAFTAISQPFAEGPWVHDSDAARAPAGVRRGWHDAGDYSVYNTTTVAAVTWLLSAALDFPATSDATHVPESANGVPDLLDEARWGLDWLQSMQTAGGGVRNNTCLETYGPYGRNDPASGPPYTLGAVGTMATARAVGAFAFAAHVFAASDADYARHLLDAATRGWGFLEARRGEHSDDATCSAYRQDGDVDAGRAVRMFAAAGLWLATGEARYHEAFDAWFVPPADPSPFRFAAYAALLYRRAPAGSPPRLAAIEAWIDRGLDEVVAASAASAYGWSGRYEWGSIPYAFERVAGWVIPRCLRNDGDAKACAVALAGLDYAFGRNPFQFVYVSGVPGATRGRQHAFHQWLATLDATPFLFPGAVAGGPNEAPAAEDGSRPLAWPRPMWGLWGDPAMPRTATTPRDLMYTDNDSWSTNELNVAWQAAALYNVLFASHQGSRPVRLPAGSSDAQHP